MWTVLQRYIYIRPYYFLSTPQRSILVPPSDSLNMTEYDFSPEAYERYMATQTRVSNWIDTSTNSTQMPSPATPPLDDSHNKTIPKNPSSSSSTCSSPYQHRNIIDLQRSPVSTAVAGRGGCWCVFVLQTCLMNVPPSTFSFTSLYLH